MGAHFSEITAFSPLRQTLRSTVFDNVFFPEISLMEMQRWKKQRREFFEMAAEIISG